MFCFFSATQDIVRVSGTDIADKVAVSSILIGDMKQRRQKDYTFSWEKVLQVIH